MRESKPLRHPGMWGIAGIAFVVLALLATIVLGGIDIGKGTTVTTRDAVQEVVIPRIDAAAPAATETATFALG